MLAPRKGRHRGSTEVERRRSVPLDGRPDQGRHQPRWEKFSTEEIEKLLVQYPGVREVAVVAMPDPLLGERSCAYLALVDGVETLALAEVQPHFAGLGVAKFKWPERIELLMSLPRTNTMKVDKHRLRLEIADRVATGSPGDVEVLP